MGVSSPKWLSNNRSGICICNVDKTFRGFTKSSFNLANALDNSLVVCFGNPPSSS